MRLACSHRRHVPVTQRLVSMLTVLACVALISPVARALEAEQLASQVTIYRDGYGVPHIDAENDAAAVFGMAYAQAEDFFWQVEDSYIRALGRLAEVAGRNGAHNDLLNRAFRIVPRSQADFAELEPEAREICEAFAAGLNHYLATHPEKPPRLINRFEPWHVLAYTRHTMLTFLMTTRRMPLTYMHGDPRVSTLPAGSNAWAIAPSRTAAGNAILFCNPHQPAFGFGQFYEAHLRSGDDWDFSGATFFGSPLPGIGHNEHLGWTHTVNKPNNVDLWLVRFDADDSDAYQFGDEVRRAERWEDTIRVKQGDKLIDETHTFRSTVHGPLIAEVGENEFLALGVAKLMEAFPARQHLNMVRARNLDEFRAAMAPLDLVLFNTVYADREGHIYFVYNGAVPVRDPQFDWHGTLDGNDPRTMWQGGYHRFDQLPQILDPPGGWLQSCNSSPFVTTDNFNPLASDFPPYMVGEATVDKLRSKVSRMILRDLKNTTLADVVELAFDRRMYWPLTQLPVYRHQFEQLKATHPELASKAAPYFEHLAEWDCVNRADSTESTLCAAWFEELYGSLYPPGDRMKPQYIDAPQRRFQALVDAAGKLKDLHGDWRVPWGEMYRLQRHADVAEFASIPFTDKQPSLPSTGVPDVLGSVLTQFYTPTGGIPLLRPLKKSYAVVGTSYLAVFEFAPEGVRGGTLIQFGSCADPQSPHFFDQAKLLSEHRLKPGLFDWQEIRNAAARIYQPGQRESGKVAQAAGQ